MCSKLGKTLGCSVSFFTTSISWIAFPIYSPAALTASFKICLPACLKNPYMISIDSLLRILLFAIFIFCLYLYFVHFVLPTLERQVELFPWSNYLDENEFTWYIFNIGIQTPSWIAIWNKNEINHWKTGRISSSVFENSLYAHHKNSSKRRRWFNFWSLVEVVYCS